MWTAARTTGAAGPTVRPSAQPHTGKLSDGVRGRDCLSTILAVREEMAIGDRMFNPSRRTLHPRPDPLTPSPILALSCAPRGPRRRLGRHPDPHHSAAISLRRLADRLRRAHHASTNAPGLSSGGGVRWSATATRRWSGCWRGTSRNSCRRDPRPERTPECGKTRDPRTGAGTKRERRFGRIDGIVVSLYSQDMTQSQVKEHIQGIYQVEFSN